MYQITLRAARTNRGLTLDEVARLVDRTPKTIAKYESDSTSIPRDLFCLWSSCTQFLKTWFFVAWNPFLSDHQKEMQNVNEKLHKKGDIKP